VRGLKTHHADSYLRRQTPRRGDYVVQVGDVQRQGGPEFAYRLRLSAPRPDFDLRVVPPRSTSAAAAASRSPSTSSARTASMAKSTWH